MSMGLRSVDLIPSGAELPAGRKSRGVSCRSVLLGSALPVWDGSVTVQVLQRGWAGAARALQSPSGAALWPGCHQEQSLLLWPPSVNLWLNKSSGTPPQCSHFSLNPPPFSCHHRLGFKVSLHLPSELHHCQGCSNLPSKHNLN